ncbi:MAG: type I CRISPR-associated protein Cas7 [Lentisphaeria bacterium]
MSEVINRATGLLVIEVRASNPNGDPDRESDPRTRNDGYGEISPVSFKRKLRDLVDAKDAPVWMALAKKRNLPQDEFQILETQGRDRTKIAAMKEAEFTKAYWDARLFGSTFLEEKKQGGTSIKTGVAQFSLGISVAPVIIERLTNTNKSGVQEGKDRGMAPLGYRVVQHAVYIMPFFINPTAAQKSGCTKRDIDLLLDLIPYAYSHTASYARSAVEIRHAWYMEHKSPLGSCSDFALLDALRPKKRERPDEPSIEWGEYDKITELPPDMQNKLADFRDLMAG